MNFGKKFLKDLPLNEDNLFINPKSNLGYIKKEILLLFLNDAD